ncbi:MAG: hypothetical protein JJ992_20565, partial [Planctomycetes bacterium]|nr:hypothetical protein [Planctomycetota bacterium]
SESADVCPLWHASRISFPKELIFGNIPSVDYDAATWKGIWEGNMPYVTEAFIFWVVLATQIAGVLSVVVARLGERSWGAAVFQRTFFVCLFAVGVATISAIHLHAASWVMGAATLGMMAVGATVDCSHNRRAAPEF